MKHIYLNREGDQERLQEVCTRLHSLSNKELIDAYNKQVECGIVGVHAQIIYLAALRQEFLQRFGKSPVLMKSNIFALNGIIKTSGESYTY